MREVLAHRLDFGGFAMVPLTLQVEAMHPAFYTHSVRPLSRYGAKVGSLQKWVAHDDCASDRGAQTFPKEEVHKPRWQKAVQSLRKTVKNTCF